MLRKCGYESRTLDKCVSTSESRRDSRIAVVSEPDARSFHSGAHKASTKSLRTVHLMAVSYESTHTASMESLETICLMTSLRIKKKHDSCPFTISPYLRSPNIWCCTTLLVSPTTCFCASLLAYKKTPSCWLLNTQLTGTDTYRNDTGEGLCTGYAVHAVHAVHALALSCVR